MMRRLIGQVKPLDHYYSLVVSEDGGENYYERSRIPIPSLHHGYGSMMFLEDGRLIVYNYNLDDEYNLSLCVK